MHDGSTRRHTRCANLWRCPTGVHWPLVNDPTSAEEWSSVATGLRSVRRGVLVTLAVCAAIVFAQAAPDNPLPPPRMSAAAIALAIATIFFRSLANSPVMNPKRRVFLALGSLLCSAAIGLLGVAAAWTGGARQIGLGFILGATILVLRPPVLAKTPPKG